MESYQRRRNSYSSLDCSSQTLATHLVLCFSVVLLDAPVLACSSQSWEPLSWHWSQPFLLLELWSASCRLLTCQSQPLILCVQNANLGLALREQYHRGSVYQKWLGHIDRKPDMAGRESLSPRHQESRPVKKTGRASAQRLTAPCACTQHVGHISPRPGMRSELKHRVQPPAWLVLVLQLTWPAPYPTFASLRDWEKPA